MAGGTSAFRIVRLVTVDLSLLLHPLIPQQRPAGHGQVVGVKVVGVEVIDSALQCSTPRRQLAVKTLHVLHAVITRLLVDRCK